MPGRKKMNWGLPLVELKHLLRAESARSFCSASRRPRSLKSIPGALSKLYLPAAWRVSAPPLCIWNSLLLPALRGATSPLGGISPGNLSSLFFTPSLKLKLLPAASVSPFVSAGGGLAHFNVNSTGSNNGAFQVGGGADFKTPVPWLGIRAELRDVISGQPNFGPGTLPADSRRHNVFVGGGVVLKF